MGIRCKFSKYLDTGKYFPFKTAFCIPFAKLFHYLCLQNKARQIAVKRGCFLYLYCPAFTERMALDPVFFIF